VGQSVAVEVNLQTHLPLHRTVEWQELGLV
jgi:hypothetical protein